MSNTSPGSHQPAATNAYLRTKVLTASPEELRMLLLDGALRFCRQGREGLDAKNYDQMFTGFSKCRDILLELASSVRKEIDPDLCGKVEALYMFLFRTLVEAGSEKNAQKAARVEKLLEYECETWRLLLAKLADEKTARAKLGLSAPAAAEPDTDRGLSVAG